MDEDANEHAFQPWFKANPWVLGSDCVRILDDRRIDVPTLSPAVGAADEFREPRIVDF